MISEETINYIKKKYCSILVDGVINEGYPVIYLIEKHFKDPPYLYIGSNFRNTATYLGSSKKLKEDINTFGKHMFSKSILFTFDKKINIATLRNIESEIQKLENVKKSHIWYNLTDIAGPGFPKNLYTGDNRTENMKAGHERLRTYASDNRTEKQKQNDNYKKTLIGDNRTENMKAGHERLKTYTNDNRTERQKQWDLLKASYVVEKRTERQKQWDLLKASYVGEKRTERQKHRDAVMSSYVGDNRTERQKQHDAVMSSYVGEKRTERQKHRDVVMSSYVGDNRTDRQKQQDSKVSFLLGKLIKLKHIDGREIAMTSIRKACSIHNLHRPSIYALLNKKITEYKGWQLNF